MTFNYKSEGGSARADVPLPIRLDTSEPSWGVILYSSFFLLYAYAELYVCGYGRIIDVKQNMFDVSVWF